MQVFVRRANIWLDFIVSCILFQAVPSLALNIMIDRFMQAMP